MTTFVDANLYHDLVNGRSVTRILHLFNKTVINWYSKRQSTVETATYGSKFVVARTAMEQIIDLRLQLWYLGVTVKGSTMMFGDNESVLISLSIPHARLHKRHTALSVYANVSQQVSHAFIILEVSSTQRTFLASIGVINKHGHCCNLFSSGKATPWI